jgi:hypothetical protein
MTAILYPVADNAERALAAPVGRATRAREALAAAKAAVVFATDATGPAFATREAAEDAYRAPLAEGYARVAEQILPGQHMAPVEPSYADGRRWPAAPPPPRTAWRLMVSYWRVGTAQRPIAPPQARKARRAGLPFAPETLKAMAGQPLRPVEPQQPLDIGLFETRLPEAPNTVIPDE